MLCPVGPGDPGQERDAVKKGAGAGGARRNALGKGLEALLPARPAGAGLREIDLDLIRPNGLQPRARFEKEKLEELAASIAANGVIQPVIVRRDGDTFELVAGERRWRAARIAGLGRIPALVQDLSDEKALELALVENIQRDELSAVEEAQAYQLLVDRFQLSQEEVARRVGRSRSAVANTLRLLKLPAEIQRSVVDGELSMGHARALLPLPRKDQMDLAGGVQAHGWSVREVERRAKKLMEGPPPSPARPDPNVEAAARRLEERWKTRVEIRARQGKGRIVLHFHSQDELDRIYQALLESGKSS